MRKQAEKPTDFTNLAFLMEKKKKYVREDQELKSVAKNHSTDCCWVLTRQLYGIGDMCLTRLQKRQGLVTVSHISKLFFV